MLCQENKTDHLLCPTILDFPILVPPLTCHKLFIVFHKDGVTYASMHHPAGLKNIDKYVKLFKEVLNEELPVQTVLYSRMDILLGGKKGWDMKKEGLYLKACFAIRPLLSKTSSFAYLSSSSKLRCQYVDESYSNISYIWAMHLGKKSYYLSSFTAKEKTLIYQCWVLDWAFFQAS